MLKVKRNQAEKLKYSEQQKENQTQSSANVNVHVGLKVVIVGTGYVGSTLAAVLTKFGHKVYAYDIDEVRIEAFKSCNPKHIERIINEPGLSRLIAASYGKNLFFTNNLYDIVEGTDVFFLCVNTPAKRDGSSDLSHYLNAVHLLAKLLHRRENKSRVVLVNKSTVPIGTVRLLQNVVNEYGVKNVGVASNPEFLAQGNAVEGSLKPDRVVIGAYTMEDFKILRQVYAQLRSQVNLHYLETTPETAEAIKYVGNTLLLTYISFWNGVSGRLAESFENIRMEDLKSGVVADARISAWGSYVSNGAGGSCFGKDIQSCIYQLNKAGCSTDLLKAVYTINEYQKSYLIDRAVYEAAFDFNQKTVALLGLAFKKDTNDMRDSAALKAVEILLGRGVKEIRVYDPLANEEAHQVWFNPVKNCLFECITYHATAKAALEGSQALLISTDWDQFRTISPTIMASTQLPYLIIDGRRILADYKELVSKGYDYLPVGGTLLKGLTT